MSEKRRILVVDDDPDIRDVLKLTLEAEGYLVKEARDGKEGLEQAQKYNPHLILLDFKMPQMTGDQVCVQLKKDPLLQHVPIIMLTSKGEITDKLEGIGAGADDYVVKPFEPTELLARVSMILRRTSRALDANPLTKLPGNASILEELQARLDKQEPIATCYVDLDKFKAFNDQYGFERGDQIIKAAAGVLLVSMRELGNPDDFLGHIGGDDFVLLTSPEAAEKIASRVVDDFAQTAPQFYDKEDLKRGYIQGQDRDGQARRFPMLTLSVAIVTNTHHSIAHVAEVAQTGAELKEWAKLNGGNRWVRDRRTEEEVE